MCILTKHFQKDIVTSFDFTRKVQVFLPKTLDVSWEMYVQVSKGRMGWVPLQVENAYRFHESGALIFSMLETPNTGSEGMWIRGRFVNSKKIEQALSEQNLEESSLHSTMLDDGSETTVVQRSALHETSLSQNNGKHRKNCNEHF